MLNESNNHPLPARDSETLRLLIENYIASAGPVSSQTLSKASRLGLSSATLRHVMAHLEAQGYLEQPHPSAGRIPTEKGFRFYVDSLVQRKPLQQELKSQIKSSIRQAKDKPEALRQVSKVLSGISRHVGLILAPKPESAKIKRIEFLSINEKQILAILVTEQGMVQNRLFELEEVLSNSDLIRMNRYLDSVLGGLSLMEVKQRILQEMVSQKDRLDQLLRKALILSEQVLSCEKGDLFIEGEKNFFNTQEFSNLHKIQEILEALGEKNRLVDFLDRTLRAPGVQIFVGHEAEPLRLSD